MTNDLATLRTLTEAAQQNVRNAITRRAGRAELKNLRQVRDGLENEYVAAQQAAVA